MKKLTLSLAASAAAIGGFAVLPAPASAQQAEVVVFGTDPCPRSTDSSIVVCSRRPEAERYRLPKAQQLQGTRQERRSWANKARDLNRVGNTGIGSCSAVGPGGSSGCLVQQIQQARRETQEETEANTAPEQ